MHLVDLQAAAVQVGLATSYVDAFDIRREVPEEVIAAILAVIASDQPAEAACLFFYDDEAAAVHLPDGATGWKITLENGEAIEGSVIPGHTQLELPLPGCGYHTLTISGAAVQEIFLIVTPRSCFQPWQPRDGRRVWGIAAQLYSLRSKRNWGIGDFTDLTELIVGTTRMGAALVGINPLHILFPDEPENASPYSPSSRQYLNWLYLDIEAVAEFATSAAIQALRSSGDFSQRLAVAQAAEFVDYTAVSRLKREALAILFDEFCARHSGHGTDRDQAFTLFCDQEGGALRRFATFQALREKRGSEDPAQRDWRQWPAELRNPETPAVVAFVTENQAAVKFHEYLQFLVEEQLRGVSQAFDNTAMAIGLYGDLAVGIDTAGSDAWGEQETVATGLAVGAPPDIFNVQGQNWGYPSSIPSAFGSAVIDRLSTSCGRS